jgi:hypothetical protein
VFAPKNSSPPASETLACVGAAGATGPSTSAYASMLPSWPIDRVANLIPSPSSAEEHIDNLALIAAESDLLIEYEYRKVHPELSHQQFLDLIRDPRFADRLRQEAKAKIGLTGYMRVMREILKKAEMGSVKAAEFLFTELGLSERGSEPTRNERAAVGDMVASMSDAMVRVMDDQRKKQRGQVMEVKAEVK